MKLTTARFLARLSALLSTTATVTFMVLGVLIVFTAGVSAVLMPVPLFLLVVSYVIARAVRPVLPLSDPLQTSIEGTLMRGKLMGKIGLFVLAAMTVTITIGVIIGLLRRGAP